MENNFASPCLDGISQLNLPTYAFVEVLSKCNFQCEHCSVKEHNCMGMETEQLLKVFTGLRAKGISHLTLAGGELFLRKDAMLLIREARKMGFQVSVISNASLLGEGIVKSLANQQIEEFTVMMYSLKSEENDLFTGIHDSLRRVIESIFLLKKYEIPIAIQTPFVSVDRSNCKDLKNFCELNGFRFCPTVGGIVNRTEVKSPCIKEGAAIPMTKDCIFIDCHGTARILSKNSIRQVI